jgi:hypothetical protein
MTSKSVFALAAILALGSLSLATDASAAHGGGGHGGGHGGGGHFGGGHFGGGHFGGGHFGGGRHVAAGHFRAGHVAARRGPAIHVGPGFHGRAFARGHRRHFWHGRWWDYGVGPCWVWSDYYGEYVWACD